MYIWFVYTIKGCRFLYFGLPEKSSSILLWRTLQTVWLLLHVWWVWISELIWKCVNFFCGFSACWKSVSSFDCGKNWGKKCTQYSEMHVYEEKLNTLLAVNVSQQIQTFVFHFSKSQRWSSSHTSPRVTELMTAALEAFMDNCTITEINRKVIRW